MKKQQLVKDGQANRLSFKEKFTYGLGDAGSNLIYMPISAYVAFFYTDVFAIGAGAVGLIKLLSRILDAFTDVFMGWLVDRSGNGKHGKCRRWLLWIPIPLAVSGVLIFTIPEVSYPLKIVYAFLTYNLMCTLYTAVIIPYTTLLSKMTRDSKERGIINIYRMFIALLTTVIATGATIPLAEKLGGGNLKLGLPLVMTIFGIIGVLFFFICFKNVKERVGTEDTAFKYSFKEGLKILFANKPWVILLFVALLGFGLNALRTQAITYYFKYFLGKEDLINVAMPISMVPLLLALPLVSFFVKAFGKKKTVMGGLVVAALGYVLILLAGKSNLALVYAGLAVTGVGLAPFVGSIYALLADTIDYGYAKTGKKVEGLIYSAASFGMKVGSGLGGAAVGFVLAANNYVANTVQTSATLGAIRFLQVDLQLIAVMVMFLLLCFYQPQIKEGAK